MSPRSWAIASCQCLQRCPHGATGQAASTCQIQSAGGMAGLRGHAGWKVPGTSSMELHYPFPRWKNPRRKAVT